MPQDSHEVPFEPEEMSQFVHRAGSAWVSAAVAAVAASLTALHGLGLAFTLGAVAAWLLWILCLGCRNGHDWRVCPLCAAPPRPVATPQARRRLARRVHRPLASMLPSMLTGVLLAHALLPKFYMHPWWTWIIAGAAYFTTATLLSNALRTDAYHDMYRDECEFEWCRARMRRPSRRRGHQRTRLWTAHFGVWGIAALSPVTCVLGIYASRHPGRNISMAYGIALVVVLLLVGDILIVHTSEPCVYCLRRLPTNGGEQAERRMRWLRLFHRIRVPLLLGAGGAWVVSWALAGTVAAKILVCAAALAVLAWAVLERRHSPLRPWCPWCRDDGGEHTCEEVPDPSTKAPAPV